MKKFLSIVLALLCLTLPLTSCTPADDKTKDTTQSTDQPTGTPEGTTAPTTPSQPLDDFEELTLTFDDTNMCTSPRDTANGEGKLVAYENWKSTDYIDVSEYHGIWYELAGHSNIQSVSFFDADKNYISGVGTTSTCSATICQGYTLIPNGTSYARFAYFEGSGNTSGDLPAMDTQCVIAYGNEASYEYARKSWKNDGIKIALLGDSLTEGDYGGQKGVPNRKLKNYPYFLSKELGCATVNYGKCGFNAESYLNLYNEGTVVIDDADIIIVMLGTNRGLGEDYLKKSYTSLIEKILEDKKEDAILVLVTPPSATTNTSMVNYGYADNVASARAYITGYISTYYGDEDDIVIIDAYLNSPIQPNMESEYQAADGLHFTESGYEAFAKYIAEEIEDLL